MGDFSMDEISGPEDFLRRTADPVWLARMRELVSEQLDKEIPQDIEMGLRTLVEQCSVEVRASGQICEDGCPVCEGEGGVGGHLDLYGGTVTVRMDTASWSVVKLALNNLANALHELGPMAQMTVMGGSEWVPETWVNSDAAPNFKSEALAVHLKSLASLVTAVITDPQLEVKR